MAKSTKPVTTEEISLARLAKFKTKKPSKPSKKTSASMDAYEERYAVWAKNIREKSKEGKKIKEQRSRIAKL